MQRGMDGMRLVTIVHNRWPPFEIILVSGHVNRDDVELPKAVCFPPSHIVLRIWMQAA